MDYTSLICSAIAFLAGLVTARSIKPAFLRLVIFILGITAITEYVVLQLPRTNTINNIYTTFSYFDISIWLYVFYRIHQKEKMIRWIVALEVIVILLSFAESYYYWGFFHTGALRLYDIVIISLSVLYLYRLLAPDYYDLSKDPLFFVCVACLSFIKFTTLSERVFFQEKIANNVFHILDAIANILYYPLLCAAFIVSYYYQQKPLKFYQSSLQS